MALSVGERELLDVGTSGLAGQLAAWNYFQSVKSPENDAFVKMWADFNEQRDKTTNDPMEATLIGFRMWAQAVVQAGTTDVNAVRQAMYGQRINAPSGFEVVMNTNHHLSKPAMIGKLNSAGTLRRGLAVDQPDQGFGLEQIYSRERQTYRRLDLPLGVRRMRRADIQGLVIAIRRGPISHNVSFETIFASFGRTPVKTITAIAAHKLGQFSHHAISAASSARRMMMTPSGWARRRGPPSNAWPGATRSITITSTPCRSPWSGATSCTE